MLSYRKEEIVKARKNLLKLTVAIVGTLLLIGVSSVYAAPILVDPGQVGSVSDGFEFFVLPVGGLLVEVLFTDLKTLELGAGLHGFFLTGLGPGTRPIYAGSFLDAQGVSIPGTEFEGKVDGDAAEVDLSETTVFRGMLFTAQNVAFDGAYKLAWFEPKPIVGQVPVPGAVWLLGSGLIGLVAIRKRFKN
jgi:hypothetical protein